MKGKDMYYFVKIPELPKELSHQSNAIELINYLVTEHQEVDVGTPIAILKNWWAIYQIEANGKGFISKTFFDRGVHVKIGDPIAIIMADGENIPYNRPLVSLSVKEILRQKPNKT